MQGIDYEIKSAAKESSDEKYLPELKSKLKEVLSAKNFDFLFYNAGTDCMYGDPLGNMRLSHEGFFKSYSTCSF